MNFTSSSSSSSLSNDGDDSSSSTPNLSFEHAANFASQLDFSKTKDTSCNLFETTIRHLGGLVSAYDLSLEPALLQKAKELGDMLLLSFDTPNGIPPFWFDFRKAKTGHLVAGNNDPSAAMGSLALEFTRLSQLTGDTKYREKVERVTDFFERVQEESRVPGIWPRMIDFQHEAVKEEGGFTLGALADSLYEYLIKMVALVGNESEEGKRYERMYKRASEVLRKEMVFRPMVPDSPKEGKGGLLFVGDLYVNSKGEKERAFEAQHLTCFSGGMFALGGKMLGRNGDVLVGEQLARGCGWAYGAFESGIMPEIFGLVGCGHGDDDGGGIDSECKWDEEKWKKENKDASGKLPKGFTKVQDSRYILRPEAIESVFVLYRITGKEELRDLAWRMWEGIRKNTETELAFSAVRDVTVVGKGEEETKNKLDSMESFWLAETLKYFYLIFSPPDVISLDDYVFNTEAHPFRRPK
ncbi:glycosylhydrolase 47-4 [Cladorrhinum sp. PSN259]|nr:glycosylhydrolase 47-4 [Cladorrhinum sp. PSN259]